jgi:RimJ/RimL family protein N-acetyltransferase
MPASHRLALDLRPATLDDVEIIADLEATRDPEDPQDPKMIRYWWTSGSLSQVHSRLVALRDGQAVAFVGAGHERWAEGPERFGSIRVVIRADLWSQPEYVRLVGRGEDWLRSEGVVTAVARVRDDFKQEVEELGRIGYREVRRLRFSELDLIANREALFGVGEQQRFKMQAQRVAMMTLSDDGDPDRLAKLHEMMVAAEQDIPSTVPIPKQPFDEWMQAAFDDPGVRADRFWIAREGEAIVGVSYLDFPPVRGLPWTAFTATSKTVRGRGIARALKYQTLAQAIELGCERVRTANDDANTPMLHINAEMGYRLVASSIELHRDLES